MAKAKKQKAGSDAPATEVTVTSDTTAPAETRSVSVTVAVLGSGKSDPPPKATRYDFPQYTTDSKGQRVAVTCPRCRTTNHRRESESRDGSVQYRKCHQPGCRSMPLIKVAGVVVIL